MGTRDEYLAAPPLPPMTMIMERSGAIFTTTKMALYSAFFFALDSALRALL